MKILMTSVFFHPHIGGIETVTENLATKFAERGDVQVKVVTNTAEPSTKDFPFEVYRRPDRKTLWQLYEWCDIYVHQGISLNWAWPLLLKRKPWFIVYHQVYYQHGWKGKLKRLCSHLSTHNIAVSETTARGYELNNYTVILNSFDDALFANENRKERRDIVFLGKVTYAKGVDVLLRAFDQFNEQTGSDYQLNIIGDSGEDDSNYEAMKHLATTLKHRDAVHFLGPKSHDELSPLLNGNKIQVVPSTYMEAFGVVCLEGMSCGCVVVGSDGDGIAEAIGEGGFTFRKGDADALCQRLTEAAALTQPQVEAIQRKAAAQLQRLSLANVAQRYIDTFKQHTKH